MKIATWNTNSLRVRIDHLERWVTEDPVDVICLQETKTVDAQFPLDAIQQMGFTHCEIYGQKSYNGVAILSKMPIQNVVKGFQLGDSDPQTRLIRGQVNGIEIVNCYVPNGNRIGSDKFRYKLNWLKRLRKELDHAHNASNDVLLCGDMNIAPDDDDTWDPFEAEGHILFHPQEHVALNSVLDWGFTDTFRHHHPTTRSFSWWDYRGGGFARNHGFRIDHIFVTPSLLNRCTSVHIQRELRGWEQPSDHVPVVASFSDESCE